MSSSGTITSINAARGTISITVNNDTSGNIIIQSGSTTLWTPGLSEWIMVTSQEKDYIEKMRLKPLWKLTTGTS
jgi:hypothetical protein